MKPVSGPVCTISSSTEVAKEVESRTSADQREIVMLQEKWERP